jgi:hypothetical protein
MTVTSPPRPPRPSDPIDRDELEALIEEARRRARRRRQMYAATAALLAVTGIALFAVLERRESSQLGSPSLSARSRAVGGAADPKIAFARLPQGLPMGGRSISSG